MGQNNRANKQNDNFVKQNDNFAKQNEISETMKELKTEYDQLLINYKELNRLYGRACDVLVGIRHINGVFNDVYSQCDICYGFYFVDNENKKLRDSELCEECYMSENKKKY